MTVTLAVIQDELRTSTGLRLALLLVLLVNSKD